MWSAKSLVYVFFLLFLINYNKNSAYGLQHWEFNHSSNYRERNNWIGNRLPCPQDSVHLSFSSGSSRLIGLTGPPLIQREILFPSDANVAFVLFDGAGLKAFQETDLDASGDCRNGGARIRDASFNLTEPIDWFRVDNWIRGSTAVQSDRFFDALLVDQLPGACDSVMFRYDATYSVKMLDLGETLPVGRLQIAGQTFAKDDSLKLEKFWRNSELLKQQFVWSNGEASHTTPFRVAVGSLDSLDSFECEVPLPVKWPKLMSRVCAGHPEAEIEASCPNPIPADEVQGACGDLCGSVALTIRSRELRLSQLREKLYKMDFLSANDRQSGLRLSVFRLSKSEPLYQLVMMMSDRSDANRIKIYEALHWLEKNSDKMRISIVKVLKSGDISSHSAKFGGLSSTTKLTTGLVIGFLLLIVAVAFVAFIFVGRRRGWLNNFEFNPRRLWQAWQQWRHQTLEETEASEGVEFTVASGSVGFTTSSTRNQGQQQQQQFETVDLAFNNPVYDVTQPDVDAQQCPYSVVVEDHEL